MADERAQLSLRSDDRGRLAIVIGGSWRVADGVPRYRELEAALAAHPASIRFEAGALETWDSALVAYVAGVNRLARERGIPVEREGLPGGVQRLLGLVEATPARHPAAERRRPPWLAHVGQLALDQAERAAGALTFLGGAAIAIARMLLGRARFRRRDLFLLVQLAGAQALGIVSLVAFLVGLILAFVGAVQLQSFGAAIYIADLVGIAMVRELGAVMAAIVVAGRTGAAYAAELGTMRVSQELDALDTLGIPPMEYLVAPRIVALTAMLPFLCLYADLMGVLGGAVVGVGLMHLGPRLYYDQTIAALSLTNLFGGALKAAVYGALVAGAGCFQGLRSGRSAAAVGLATTAAVVDGIVLVIAACGLFAVVFYQLGI